MTRRQHRSWRRARGHRYRGFDDLETALVDDDVGDHSPFFPAEIARAGGPGIGSLGGSDDSTPRPYQSLEERMAARGWRWSGNQLKDFSADGPQRGGQPSEILRAAAVGSGSSNGCEPDGPPPPLLAGQWGSVQDGSEQGEEDEIEEGDYGGMYSGAGAGVEGVSSSDDEAQRPYL